MEQQVLRREGDRMRTIGRGGDQTLLRDKFEADIQPRTAIARPRLLDELEASAGAKVVLLSAPAGSGKSVLLEQWVGGRPRHEWAWVSLEAADEDPVRFWSCVAEAVRRAGHDPPERTADRLDDGVAPAVMATAAAGDIAAASGLRVLVLDDFHLAAGSQVEAGVALLAELLPPGLRLAIGTRSDPELPLHRWRLRGELCELRAHDLRFRDEEVDRLFAGRHGLVLGTEDRASLLHHTEGWAAGLQLAALSLRDGSDVPELLERFASTHQPLLDFLASEVLDRQPPWRRRFLQAAACVGEFCPAVLDAVLDRDDSSEVLRGVRADNLFLVPLDHWPGWFRFHHLFGQFLRLDLHAVDPDRERELRRRAGLWMRANGHAALAVDHLVEAGELDPALRVVESRLIRYFDRGRRATITRWIERFPDEFLAARPDRCVVAATARLAGGDPGRALRWLRRWEQFPDGGDPAIAARAHAVTVPTLLFVGDVDGCLAGVRTALDELRCRPWRPFVPSRLLGFAARAHELRGDLASARRCLDRAAGDPGADATSVDVLIPGVRSIVALVEGALREAADMVGKVALAEDSADGGRPYTVFAALTRAALALEHGDPDAADATADRVRLAGTDLGMWTTVVDACIVLAQAHHARGDAARTFEHLAHARSLVREVGMHAAMLARIDAAEVRARIAVDDLDRAQLLLAGVPRGCRGVLEARLALARGDDDEARARLAGGDAVRLPLRLCIEREVVLACASARAHPAGAERHIDRALGLAEPEGYRTSILAGGAGPRGTEVVRDLVVGAVGRRRSRYVAALAQAAEPGRRPASPPGLGPAAQADPLTPAEQRVLFYLASNLTVAELARQLGVSPNTVKTQVKCIYRKLDVNSRDAATERARALGLR
jgi:LuxR family maltose regulon positive regulatory protein